MKDIAVLEDNMTGGIVPLDCKVLHREDGKTEIHIKRRSPGAAVFPLTLVIDTELLQDSHMIDDGN